MAYTKLAIGESYTRDQIHATLGGGLQEFLPTKDGRVVCACLRASLHPEAPERVWVAQGARREATAKVAVVQGTPFPVFLRRDGPNSEYLGKYRAVHYRTCRDGEPETIAGVLTLEKVPTAEDVAVAGKTSAAVTE